MPTEAGNGGRRTRWGGRGDSKRNRKSGAGRKPGTGQGLQPAREAPEMGWNGHQHKGRDGEERGSAGSTLTLRKPILALNIIAPFGISSWVRRIYKRTRSRPDLSIISRLHPPLSTKDRLSLESRFFSSLFSRALPLGAWRHQE